LSGRPGTESPVLPRGTSRDVERLTSYWSEVLGGPPASPRPVVGTLR
jgi:hypothetical protein